MKAHIGTDTASGLTHSLSFTAANVNDVTQTAALLHGEEEMVFADAGYTGAHKRAELCERDIQWQIAMKRGQRKALTESLDDPILDPKETFKAKLRSKVEHVFRVIKCQFGYRKTRYRGLSKNAHQLRTMFALANLYIARHRLI